MTASVEHVAARSLQQLERGAMAIPAQVARELASGSLEVCDQLNKLKGACERFLSASKGEPAEAASARDTMRSVLETMRESGIDNPPPRR